MGLREWLFGRTPEPKEREYEGTFKMLNGYTPRFTTWQGGIYESQLVRAAINATATHCSKLRVEVLGAAQPKLRDRLKHAPNRLQTWSQFMYRLATILEVNNTAFIIPVYDEYGDITGIHVPLTTSCRLEQYKGEPWLIYEFNGGERTAERLSRCAVMTKFQYKHDIFGDNNAALLPTMDLISIQNQGIQEGVKSAATYRFMAQVNNFSKAEDLARERQRFTEENLSKNAKGGGLLLFPNTYKDIKQIDVKPWVIDSEQLKIINENVYEYFGVNEDILMNRAYGDKWTAFYEGKIEPFAIQFSETVTKMLFTLREQSQGNEVMATANRLQYLSNAEKLNVSAQLLDRGIISINDARDIWNLPHVEGGDVRIIRGEYWNADEKVTEVDENEPEPGISDDGTSDSAE